MIQQINLYSEIFEPQKIIFPLKSMLVTGFVFIGLCAGFNFYMSQSLAKVKQQVVMDKKVTRDLEQVLIVAREKNNTRKPDLELDQQIASRQRYLANGRILYQQLINEIETAKAGFYHKLAALSDNTIDGLWLTKIQLNHYNLTLSGKSLNSNFIPNWISGFSNTMGLQTTKLTKLEISEETDSVVNFEISNARDANDG